MDRGERSGRGGASTDENQGRSHTSAKRASEEICETGRDNHSRFADPCIDCGSGRESNASNGKPHAVSSKNECDTAGSEDKSNADTGRNGKAFAKGNSRESNSKVVRDRRRKRDACGLLYTEDAPVSHTSSAAEPVNRSVACGVSHHRCDARC